MSDLSKLAIIHHSCGHTQEHVVPSMYGPTINVWFKYDWQDRLQRVPCLECCKSNIELALEALTDQIKKMINK